VAFINHPNSWGENQLWTSKFGSKNVIEQFRIGNQKVYYVCLNLPYHAKSDFFHQKDQ
jgi:hypothetical protein